MAQMFAEMDTDKDGSLSLAEYIGSLSDKEDDGIMSADELADEESGMSPDELADREMSPDELADMNKEMKVNFDKLDEDKSGKLSQAEMAKACRPMSLQTRRTMACRPMSLQTGRCRPMSL